MRISDWSSDVCSSDLTTQPACKSCEQTQANLLHHPESIDPLDSSKQSTSQRSTKQSRVKTPAALQEDRKSTRLNSSHSCAFRMPSSARTSKLHTLIRISSYIFTAQNQEHISTYTLKSNNLIMIILNRVNH